LPFKYKSCKHLWKARSSSNTITHEQTNLPGGTILGTTVSALTKGEAHTTPKKISLLEDLILFNGCIKVVKPLIAEVY
jgi:hypothetical protein